MGFEPDESMSRRQKRDVVFPRLLIGLIILICAEVFSGASLQIGIWNPWTLVVTYWLYFAHFFFFTTLAIRTGRTSLGALYLWGVLFGLYESWITKVIWYGYGGDGKLILGRIGPYGFGELSMVFLFHPVMSFLLPLAVACLLCPPIRRWFPDLAWFSGTSKAARVTRAYLVFSLAPVVGLNSGGPINLALNMVLIVGLLAILSRLAWQGFADSDGRSVVEFGRWGFVGLCFYLALLYGVFYFVLKPEGLPSARVQLLTLLIYALIIVGLTLHQPREPLPGDSVAIEARELPLALSVFAWVIGLGFVLSFAPLRPVIFVPIVLNGVLWTSLGFVFTVMAFGRGVNEFRNPRSGIGSPAVESCDSLNTGTRVETKALDDPDFCVP